MGQKTPHEYTRLLEESRRREAWLRASNEITATLLAGNGSELELVTHRAREVAGAPLAALALPDEHAPGTLFFPVVEGAEHLAGTSITIEGTASGLVFSSGQPLLIDNYGDAAAAWQGDSGSVAPSELKPLGSAAIVPLTAGTETLGVLLLCRLRTEPLFGQADLDLLNSFAAHAALALQYAAARADQQRLVVLEDRDRIARDLHDLVIQRIFATGMALEAAASVIAADPGDAAARIRSAVDDLDETIQEIRTTVFALQHPPVESLRSLVLTVAGTAEATLGFKPSVRFLGPVDTSVPGNVCDQMLPVLREALSNVVRHAHATSVTIEVTAGDELSLRVIDNGIGVPAGGRRSGLNNMAVRARRLGGSFTLTPANPGTELRWNVPLD
ncbi:histidine kinase [Kibdelosporangium persicum]|uniref:Redox sensor histidine kinase response regulator DevS n=1 Tax=Kibdelosporangium persicum TaxID=2698649 RepID=A0ABX2F2D1_9PSEU|nr:histidine kinase [Kibdelosporangium persicum]NRN65038.1 Redox sensor histidine kinase response regulator DevS [Kibdelosporangium persicum]